MISIALSVVFKLFFKKWQRIYVTHLFPTRHYCVRFMVVLSVYAIQLFNFVVVVKQIQIALSISCDLEDTPTSSLFRVSKALCPFSENVMLTKREKRAASQLHISSKQSLTACSGRKNGMIS